MKKKAQGLKFIVPLAFGDWPIEQIEEQLEKIESEYDLSRYRLKSISRGGYTRCEGFCGLEACEELFESYGRITWRRVR